MAKGKEDISLDLQISFLDSILYNHVEQNNRLDQKASFLLGISGLIFTLTLTQLIIFKETNLERISLFIIALSSLASSILAIWTIRPPFTEQHEKPTLMFYRGFKKLTMEDYKKKLLEVIQDKEKLVGAYAKEIFCLSKVALKPKYKLIKKASWFLTIGLITGGVLFLIGCLI
jgi:hypothetical protein